jgi:hypothetical protein
MTPTEYLAELNLRMEAGQFQEALDFAKAHGDTVRPPLSGEELERLLAIVDIADQAAASQRALAADREASA